MSSNPQSQYSISVFHDKATPSGPKKGIVILDTTTLYACVPPSDKGGTTVTTQQRLLSLSRDIGIGVLVGIVAVFLCLQLLPFEVSGKAAYGAIMGIMMVLLFRADRHFKGFALGSVPLASEYAAFAEYPRKNIELSAALQFLKERGFAVRTIPLVQICDAVFNTPVFGCAVRKRMTSQAAELDWFVLNPMAQQIQQNLMSLCDHPQKR